MSTIASEAPADVRVAASPAPRARRLPLFGLAMALVVVISTAVTVLAMRRTSTTFDEIVLIAGGARGLHMGDFGLAPDHPPVMQYLYGLPAYLSRPNYPVERPGRWLPRTRYNYARGFFWRNGNDPERLAFRSRLVASLLAAGMVLLTWGFTRRRYGPAAALLAGTLVAFLPDMLAHGGVAYNDVPMALSYLATLWAVDEAARRPSLRRGVLAGALAALAVGIKYSALVIAPAALLLVLAEAFTRRGDAAWARRLALSVAVALATMYVGLVLIYRGDFALAALRFGITQQLQHVGAVRGAPNYMLGRFDPFGWWYYYPVAFLFKTSAALHLLIIAALAGFAAAWAPRGSARGPAADAPGQGGAAEPAAAWQDALRRVLASPLRVPLLGAVVFGLVLLRSRLDIGFRYALPALPLLCILTAVGVTRFWLAAARRAWRWALALLLAWYVAAPLLQYPWFLSYMSEYGPGRDSAYEVLVDSNIDWGQGLLALRDYMREQHIPSVYLSYFGSAPPDGYGIVHTALPSFFPLLPSTAPGPEPRWVAVSATNLEPVYIDDPQIATLRRARPDAVVGGSIYLYRIR